MPTTIANHSEIAQWQEDPTTDLSLEKLLSHTEVIRDGESKIYAIEFNTAEQTFSEYTLSKLLKEKDAKIQRCLEIIDEYKKNDQLDSVKPRNDGYKYRSEAKLDSRFSLNEYEINETVLLATEIVNKIISNIEPTSDSIIYLKQVLTKSWGKESDEAKQAGICSRLRFSKDDENSFKNGYEKSFFWKPGEEFDQKKYEKILITDLCFCLAIKAIQTELAKSESKQSRSSIPIVSRLFEESKNNCQIL